MVTIPGFIADILALMEMCTSALLKEVQDWLTAEFFGGWSHTGLKWEKTEIQDGGHASLAWTERCSWLTYQQYGTQKTRGLSPPQRPRSAALGRRNRVLSRGRAGRREAESWLHQRCLVLKHCQSWRTMFPRTLHIKVSTTWSSLSLLFTFVQTLSGHLEWNTLFKKSGGLQSKVLVVADCTKTPFVFVVADTLQLWFPKWGAKGYGVSTRFCPPWVCQICTN